jgi:hypothetical protein
MLLQWRTSPRPTEGSVYKFSFISRTESLHQCELSSGTGVRTVTCVTSNPSSEHRCAVATTPLCGMEHYPCAGGPTVDLEVYPLAKPYRPALSREGNLIVQVAVLPNR